MKIFSIILQCYYSKFISPATIQIRVQDFERNYIQTILIHKSQQDAHVTEFILSENCSTCSGVTFTHLQEHKTTVTTASGNRYTLIDRVKLTHKEYR